MTTAIPVPAYPDSMTEPQAADYLGRSIWRLRQRRGSDIKAAARGADTVGPPWFKERHSNRVIYRRADLDRWLATTLVPGIPPSAA